MARKTVGKQNEEIRKALGNGLVLLTLEQSCVTHLYVLTVKLPNLHISKYKHTIYKRTIKTHHCIHAKAHAAFVISHKI